MKPGGTVVIDYEWERDDGEIVKLEVEAEVTDWYPAIRNTGHGGEPESGGEVENLTATTPSGHKLNEEELELLSPELVDELHVAVLEEHGANA